jgi:hypothetical protein
MGKIKLTDDIALYTNDTINAVANSPKKKLIISTHGGWGPTDGTFTVGEVGGTNVSFYSSENFCVTGDVEDALAGNIHTIDSATTTVKNYELTRFEHDPRKADLEPHLNDEFDVMKVRTRLIGKDRAVRLKDALQTLSAKGYRYGEICCLFCRYTGVDASMSARQRTAMEAERLDKIAKSKSIAAELKGRRK